jgi:hypothetical protein
MNIEHPDILQELFTKATSNVDDLLDETTSSLPAVWDRSSQSLYRVHLSEDDERLPLCKSKIKNIKEMIKTQLQEECGETWMHRMPLDVPIQKDPEVARIY